jgi:glutathione S-transferase
VPGLVEPSAQWEALEARLRAQQTDGEKSFRADLASGRGPPSPLATLRLFDAPEDYEPRVTLYRDSAAWCPYCHKVWLCIEERRIPYRVEKVNMSCYGDKPLAFRMLQPSGQIPVAVIDGVTYGQSNDIINALGDETMFPVDEGGVGSHPPLLPTSSPSTRSLLSSPDAASLLRLERQFFGAWLGWLCAGSGPGSGARRVDFESVLATVEEALAATASEGPYFLGGAFSVVDAMYAPFLERAAASLAYFKGFVFRAGSGGGGGEEGAIAAEAEAVRQRWPHVNAWFDAMEGRPAYRATKSDYYTHAHDLPPQLGGCGMDPANGRPVADVIDGINGLGGAAWHLPSSPSASPPSASFEEPDWAWVGEAEARREAAERLIFNHARVASFACRGAGRAGVPGVRAPLADPNAAPDASAEPAVDAMLRCVAMALLDGGQEAGEGEGQQGEGEGALEALEALEATARSIREAGGGGGGAVGSCVASLGYLRDRVGVPRDMSFPAAKQLRAHLNLAVATLTAPGA